jgi:hypothetical protein
MGRHYYLERLALGRSPFVHGLAHDASEGHNGSPVQTQSSEIEPQRSQQYNDKGRPINPATEERNRNLRHAQNAVLELVGAVESEEHDKEVKFARIREERERVLKEEDERGEELQVVEAAISSATIYFPDAMFSRILAELYPTSEPFADAIFSELGTSGNRTSTVLNLIYPSLTARVVCAILEMASGAAAAELITWLQIRLMKRFKRNKRLNMLANGLCESLLTVIDVALLPLKYHELVQTLGLAPTRPLLPGWRAFLPNDPASPHGFLWRPMVGNGPLSYVTSPAVMILAWTFLTRSQDNEYPVANQFTSFKYPAVNTAQSLQSTFDNKRPNALDQLLHNFYLLRQSVMHSLGYKLREKEANKLHNHVTPLEINYDPTPYPLVHRSNDRGPCYHRSTKLALMSARFLAERIDSFISRIWTLPIEAAMLKTVARSYLSSSLPKTAFAVAVMHNSVLAGHVTPRDLGSRLSKIGLGIALYCTIEAGVFFAVHGLARWQGIKYFNWGYIHDPTQYTATIGDITYTRTPPSAS